MTDTHSCSYFCTRPACVLAQRDELVKRVFEENAFRQAARKALDAMKDVEESVDEDCDEPDCEDCRPWRPFRSAIEGLEYVLRTYQPTNP